MPCCVSFIFLDFVSTNTKIKMSNRKVCWVEGNELLPDITYFGNWKFDIKMKFIQRRRLGGDILFSSACFIIVIESNALISFFFFHFCVFMLRMFDASFSRGHSRFYLQMTGVSMHNVQCTMQVNLFIYKWLVFQCTMSNVQCKWITIYYDDIRWF